MCGAPAPSGRHRVAAVSTVPATPLALITWAHKEFEKAHLCYGHGTDNAYDEAVYLVLRSLGLEFDVPDEILNQTLDEKTAMKVMALANDRITLRKPVAYLINEAWFAGLPFYVDERVLIPRSPIAELIEERFSPWIEEDRVKRILDIGTGSGCIAIACALAFPGAVVDAVDISLDAEEVARVNVEKLGAGGRVNVLHSDLYQNLKGRRYDIIIANPPYVSTGEYMALPEEYRHEPVIGLEAGADGLDVIRRILMETKPHLNDHGILIVEAGNSQDAVARVFPDLPFIWLEFERGGEGVFLLTADSLR